MVYVSALAARAGYLTSVPEPDRDSVDLEIHGGGDRRPSLNIQLKASTTLKEIESEKIPFSINRKNYDDLREDTQVPRLLVVLDLPDEPRWMSVTMEELILRRRAYWLSLQKPGHPAVDQENITIYLQTKNVLNVASLKLLMEKSRSGEI